MERKLYTEDDRPEWRCWCTTSSTATRSSGTTRPSPTTPTSDPARGDRQQAEGTDNYRKKFKAVPWTSKDGDAFPDGQHIAFTHWSKGGGDGAGHLKQVGAWQYCSEVSGEALDTS